jgi:hypothetical protein
VDAVASGAVLSTYQRTRVESVCERLGLQSLAFLWQVSQSVSQSFSPSFSGFTQSRCSCCFFYAVRSVN